MLAYKSNDTNNLNPSPHTSVMITLQYLLLTFIFLLFFNISFFLNVATFP